MAQQETGEAHAASSECSAEEKSTAAASKTANEARLEEAVRAAKARSAEDQAALERVRRKLVRLMLVSLTVTFIALAVVAAAIIYKIAHTASAPAQHKAAAPQAEPAENQAQAKAAHEASGQAGVSGIFIQTAPNSGAEEYFAREKQAEAQAAKTAQTVPQQQELPLAAGEKLVSQSLSGTLLLLRIAAPAHGTDSAQTILLIYDFSKGKIIARLHIAEQK